jgi:malonate decarboxylase acyl carrier protein
MQTLNLTFPATSAVNRSVHVGVVGSGDLEVLVSPTDRDAVVIRVRTSVDGFDEVWTIVLTRFFTEYPAGGRYEINDFGATPGMVTLRLRQALQEAEA